MKLANEYRLTTRFTLLRPSVEHIVALSQHYGNNLISISAATDIEGGNCYCVRLGKDRCITDVLVEVRTDVRNDATRNVIERERTIIASPQTATV